MEYRITPETEAVEAMFHALYVLRGKTLALYQAADAIADLHKRVETRARVRELLARLDQREAELNRAFAAVVAAQNS